MARTAGQITRYRYHLKTLVDTSNVFPKDGAPQETHFAFEIMMIIDGERATILKAGSLIFVANDVILIPPGTRS